MRHGWHSKLGIGAMVLAAPALAGALFGAGSGAATAAPLAGARPLWARSAPPGRVVVQVEAPPVGEAVLTNTSGAAAQLDGPPPVSPGPNPGVTAGGGVAVARPDSVTALPWAPAGLRPAAMRCGARHGRRFCDGPRRVPRPYGAAAERAERLGLGTWAAAAKLLRSEPRSRWQQAVRELRIDAPRELMWPVDGGIFGRGFGPVLPPHQERIHPGIDIDGQQGQPVRAVADGLVAYADNGIRGMGNLVLVLHGGTTVGVYAHLQEAHVIAGQRVRRGDILGRLGATGLAGGPHLHFEWHVRGDATDPAYLFAQ